MMDRVIRSLSISAKSVSRPKIGNIKQILTTCKQTTIVTRFSPCHVIKVATIDTFILLKSLIILGLTDNDKSGVVT